MNRKLAALAILATSLLGACSFLEPQPDRSRFYLLTPVAVEQDIEPSPGMLGLGPLQLPDYLDRTQMVTRVGPNQIRFSEHERWAERLEHNFTRVVSENLARLLATDKIVRLPAFAAMQVDYQLPIEVLRFEGDEAGNVELVARWAIRKPRGDGVLYSTESRYTDQASSPGRGAIVAAQSRAVGALSQDIANAIRRLAGKSSD